MPGVGKSVPDRLVVTPAATRAVTLACYRLAPRFQRTPSWLDTVTRLETSSPSPPLVATVVTRRQRTCIHRSKEYPCLATPSLSDVSRRTNSRRRRNQTCSTSSCGSPVSIRFSNCLLVIRHGCSSKCKRGHCLLSRALLPRMRSGRALNVMWIDGVPSPIFSPSSNQ